MKKKTTNPELLEILKDLPASEQQELSLLAEKLTKTNQMVAPSHLFRESSQKRVLAKIFAHRIPFWHGALEFFWSAKFPTAVTALALVLFVSTFSIVMKPYTSSARDNAVLRNVNGTVWLKRGDNTVPAKDGEKIYTGDTLMTEGDSKAEIQFADLSVSRMDELTNVRIAEVADTKETALFVPTKIEVGEGKVWTQTQKTPDSPKFEVITPHGKVQATQASFGVEVNDDATEVIVKENIAEVTPNNIEEQALVVTQKITEDQKITMAKDNEDVQVEDAEDDEWIAENVQADAEYQDEIQAESDTIAKETAGTLPGDTLYSVKQISEVARDKLTLEPNEKLKLKIELAKTRLAEAKTLLASGKNENVLEAVRSFEVALAAVKEEAYSEEELSEEIKTMMAELDQELLTVLPDSELYIAKVAVRNMKSEFNQNDELDNKLLYQNQNLIEAKNLVNKNDALVKNIIHSYYINSRDLFAKLTTLDDVKRFIDQKNVELQIIQNIEVKMQDTNAKAEINSIASKIQELIDEAENKLATLTEEQEASEPVVVEELVVIEEPIVEEEEVNNEDEIAEEEELTENEEIIEEEETVIPTE